VPRPSVRDLQIHPIRTSRTPELCGTQADEPTDYWLSNLPKDTPIEELVRLAKIRWRVEHDYRELKTGLGLDHFEGRSHTGWHRHVTLAALAQAFCTMIRNDPKVPAPG
jgi:SRSO17 transposase